MTIAQELLLIAQGLADAITDSDDRSYEAYVIIVPSEADMDAMEQQNETIPAGIACSGSARLANMAVNLAYSVEYQDELKAQEDAEKPSIVLLNDGKLVH